MGIILTTLFVLFIMGAVVSMTSNKEESVKAAKGLYKFIGCLGCCCGMVILTFLLGVIGLVIWLATIN